MKTIIIDDERLAREELKNLLSEFPELEIIGECANGKEGIENINKLKPDLIFLDIQMPEINGFEMLEHLDHVPMVIFVTAYDEFAIKAFEVNALDYLLKPVDPNRLKETINKIKTDIEPGNSASIEKLGENDRIFIKDGEKCWFVDLKDIRMFESEGNYVKVHFDRFRPLILRSLNSLEEKLDEKLFFRANRKYIINLKKISNIENWFNGGLQVELNEGEKVEISRRQAIKFKDKMSI
ncbi:MAG: LytTR family transcriptional regulator DNA-binding domain-containing protein [Crocinitomicaceae bacterium]|nr:LytTR family transcriptional regulator DNA-binding domain-containing protein [Crocinitomicaceae bacterium]